MQAVSVLLDHPHPEGSPGLTQASLSLTYDPTALTIAAADITLGTIPAGGSGWRLTSTIDAQSGQIGILLFSDTPIAAPAGGSLVNLLFHLMPRALAQSATPIATTVRLVDSTAPDGQQFYTTLTDPHSGMILSPGLDRVTLRAGMSAARRVCNGHRERVSR